MTRPDESPPDDDQLASWLVAYDEASSGGTPVAPPDEAALPAGLRERLRRARECVDL